MNRTLFSTQAVSLLLSQSQSPNLRLEQKQYQQPFLFQRVLGLIPSPCVWRGLWDKPLRRSSICSLWQCIISGRFPQISVSEALGWMLLSHTRCALFVFLAVTLPPLKRRRWEAYQAVSVWEAAETWEGILIFNPVPAPSQLVICFCGTLVSEGTIPFKKDVMFSHQVDITDFPQ